MPLKSRSARDVWCVEIHTSAGEWLRLPEECDSAMDAVEVLEDYRDEGILESPDHQYTRLRVVTLAESLAGASTAVDDAQTSEVPTPATSSELVEAPGRRSLGWDSVYELLCDYADSAGRARPPGHHREGEVALGHWVRNQRDAYRAGRLSMERQRRLEALPGWVWHTHEARWLEGYERLRCFCESTGHAAPPPSYVSPDGFRLGIWVANQRTAYRLRSRLNESLDRRSSYAIGAMTPRRIACLEALRGWTWRPSESRWERNVEALAQFTVREGHASPEIDHIEDGLPLGAWVRTARRSYLAGTLPQDRVDQLSAFAGWTWSPRDQAWERGFSALQRYTVSEGHATPPRRYTQAGFALGTWVSKQRRAYRLNQLSQDRTERLEELHGWTWLAPRP